MRVLLGEPSVWETQPGGVAVSIGVFDGVHLGHRQMLNALAEDPVAGSLPRGAITFDRHPLATIAPERTPLLITTPEERLALFEQAGLDFAAVLTFDDRMRSLPADAFVESVLAGALGARLVVVGEGFRFGRDAGGDVDELRRLGDHFGFAVRAIPLLETAAGPISSSLIRARLGEGDVAAAAELLGRPFARSGRVVAGDRRGSSIGFPTANLELTTGLVVPARGVYAAHAVLDERHPAVVNIGVRPTFDGTRQVVEAHILDYSGDLYGVELRLEFLARLRSEQKFESVEALTAQIATDVEAARKLLNV